MSYACLVASVNVLQKNIYFWTKRNECENLVLRVNQIFKFTSDTLLEEKDIQRYLRFMKKLTCFCIINGQVLSVLLCCLPIIFKCSNARTLPISMWVPYEWKESPMYELTYFLQVSFTVIVAFIHMATDAFFAALTLLTAGQFQILGWEFKNLLYTNLIRNGIPKKTVLKYRKQFDYYVHNNHRKVKNVVLDLIDSEKFNEDMLKSTLKLIKFHQSLLSVCTDLEEYFSSLMLVYYIFLTPIALFLNFIILTTQDTLIKLLFVPLCLLSYFELLLPCYIANILTTQAENLQREFYEIPWYLFTKELKTVYKFLALKMRMPVSLTVGRIADLNLRLFLSVLKTLNSYSLMMYQLNQKNSTC